MDYLISSYNQLNVTFVRGSGCWLADETGQQYLDAISGVGVVNLGHCHKNITKVIHSQAETLIHTSNWYHIKNQQELAKKICQLTNMDKAFFANSGAEANEAAIKIARLYGHNKNINTPIILSAKKSFHGRTMATLSATGNTKIQEGFTPLLSEFIHVDFNDIDAINKHKNNKNIVAIMLEPIQGETGIIIPSKDYLNKVRKICSSNNWLLILDEIQTGMGRTGKLFAHEYNNITPDIITIAKGLGNGIPIGACLAKGVAAQTIKPGNHGSTFGGNPFACAVATEVINTIQQQNILANTQNIGKYILTQLKSQLKNTPTVVDIRGRGLMLAIDLNQDCANVLKLALEDKLLINTTGHTIRLLPPLIINKQEADILINKICAIIKSL